ncbi:elongation factor G [Exilibacterium tricleocarpae]|uniref:Elongation factor G n=1 Tax=Exilibacterium tricleocarpae TaxID=2591008 RepID=A0A545U6L3_9GAMM|nr:elongation factor G [Exilibacterium tricleocarpae]TQV85106.1 elongation factor G [Exilibacterium tricleocarpae]
MPRFSTENIRNIAVLGHAGVGKTTLVESLLQAAGAIQATGSVERGTTVCDFDPRERQLQHSLDPTLCSFDHAGGHVNLLDTPGYPDFYGRAISILPAVDSVAVCVSAQCGIEQATRRMMEVALERNLCRMLVINKIDAAEVDFAQLIADLQQAFGPECLPINLPGIGGDTVVDCFFEHGEQPTACLSVAAAHTAIVDQVVELDETLMQLYLEQGEELNPEQLHAPFEQALREGHLIPICFVSARSGAGIAQLLDIFAKLMPNPLEGNPPVFLRGEAPAAVPVDVVADPKRHLVAHVFKVAVDPYLGRLGVFRVHQGKVSTNAQLFIGDGRKPFKVAHLLKLQGKKHTEIHAAVPGDICAVARVDDIHFDAVLHDSHDEDHYHLRSLTLPPPMCGLAILPTRRGDEQKLADALHKLAAEDPSLRIEHRPAQNETVLYGCGDLHLRIVLDKMRDQYQVPVATRPPSIAYRETVTTAASGHHRHKKQTGGAGQFGEVFLKVEPLARGGGFEFVDKVVGGAIPHTFIPAVEKGVRQVLELGAIAGFPLQDVRVILQDGKHHAVDSKEIAFVMAGKRAFLDAVRKADPIVLEPIVGLTIAVPAAAVGDITGDLAARRGLINGTSALPGGRVEVAAKVPLAELNDYQSKLKSMTAGEGSYTLVLSHYDALPAKQQSELTLAFRAGTENE